MTYAFQLERSGPSAYDQFLVPAFFAPCADALLAVEPPRSGERVLDLACGTGIVARRVAALTGPTGHVVGVDINAAMVDYARRIPADNAAAIEWHVADAGALPLADDSIDVGCCQQGLQFLPDASIALQELRRVVAPDGRVLLAVWGRLEQHPAFAALVTLLERHIGSAAAAMMRAPFAGPEPEVLRRWLITCGFPVVHVESKTFPARFASVRTFLHHEVAGSPLRGPVEQTGAAATSALLADLEESLASYVDDRGLAITMQTWLILAQSGP